MFFFSSRRRHTRYIGDWSSDVCSSDLQTEAADALGMTYRQRMRRVVLPQAFKIVKIGRASGRERVGITVVGRNNIKIKLHEVITFWVSMQISISSLQTHNVNRCGRSRD